MRAEDEPELTEEKGVEENRVAEEHLEGRLRMRDAERDDSRRGKAERHPSIGDPQRVTDAALARERGRPFPGVVHGVQR